MTHRSLFAVQVYTINQRGFHVSNALAIKREALYVAMDTFFVGHREAGGDLVVDEVLQKICHQQPENLRRWGVVISSRSDLTSDEVCRLVYGAYNLLLAGMQQGSTTEALLKMAGAFAKATVALKKFTGAYAEVTKLVNNTDPLGGNNV